MPTPEQAIHMAAWEAISHIHHLVQLMQQKHVFNFLPTRPCASQDVVMTDTDKENDTAVVHLVQYITASETLIHNLVEQIHATRIVLAHT
jgi:hypothetical protein